jgi:hypothetical protein
MVRAEALDEPLDAVLNGLKEAAANVARGSNSSAARDLAEAAERLANAARVLIEAQEKLPAG